MSPRGAPPEPQARLGWDHVLAWRAERQHLAERLPAARALEVVADLAGLHAQLAASPELALLARVDGLERGTVGRELWERRTLVRTWAMRGTLHLLASAELGLWTAAQARLRPRHHQPTWLRHHGLTREQAEAMLAAIPAALADAPQGSLSRAELAREVARRVPLEGLEERLKGGFGDLLKPAAFRGELCFAPGEGQAARFARPRDWLGPSPPVDPEQASREVARRYLAAYGPATREQFARWFGMSSPAEAERWLRALGERVVGVEVEGTRAWLLAEHVEAAGSAAPAGTVRLLPAFDQHVVAAPRDEAGALAPEARDRVYRPQGWLSPVVLVDGRIRGTWSHERERGRLLVSLAPFAPLTAEERERARLEAARLAAFEGLELELG